MGMEPQPQVIDYASPARPRGYYRWVICALIFFATTVNYVDRQIIGVLAPTLKRELKWSDAQYGDIVFYFQLAYAIGLLLSGPVIAGAAGLLWLCLWLPMYQHPRRHPLVSPSELAWIERDPPEPENRLPWRELVQHRQAWAFAAGKFITDPIWWFYLYWTSLFLDAKFGIKLS